jgi:hypothetical protein
VADPQTTIVSASAVGAVECVATNPGTPTTTIVSAGSTSGAECVTGSIHFNPPLSTVSEIQEIDGVTGVVLPPSQGFAVVGQRTLTSLGKPHFAFALTNAVPGSFSGGGDHGIEVVFRLERLPVAQVSSSEPHWLVSYHEAGGLGRELLSLGVTPSGAIAIGTRENGTVLSAAGVCQVDDLFHAIRLWHFVSFGSRQLFVDNVCVLDVVGPVVPDAGQPPYTTGTDEHGYPLYHYDDVRMTLFNGRDGLSVISASVAYLHFGFEDYSITWAVDEGFGPTITGVEFDPFPSRISAVLEATWWNGAPIGACPDFPSLPLASAYAWQRTTAWTPRPPYSPTYTKVVSV